MSAASQGSCKGTGAASSAIALANAPFYVSAMTNDVMGTADYRRFIAELKSRVQAAQIKAAVAVNRELLILYWDLGRMITERQEASGWGDGVIKQIATDLSREFPHLKGFSRSNLYNIKQWYTFYVDQDESVQQAVGQIP